MNIPCYSHNNLFSLLSPSKLEFEIKETNKILYDILNKEIQLFATPVGHNNIFLRSYLRKYNMLLLGWDINPHDAMSNQALPLQSLLKKIQKKSKPIILLHDGVYAPATQNREITLEFLNKLFSYEISN